MESHARAEWHRLTEVVIHRPGIEMFFGLLDPFSFLYERAFSMDEAVYEHRNLEHTLTQLGVKVHRLKGAAVQLAKDNPALLEEARKRAQGIVKFIGPKGEVQTARREFGKNVEIIDPETIFNILLLRPSLRLRRGKGTRIVHPHVSLDVPLANLYFMRDQQALTDRGVVVGRMAKPQRRVEPLLTSAVLQVMGAKIVHRVRPPGSFEGGDFIPAGDFAMIGLGDRTNRNGVNQILRNGVGFDEVAVVHQATHPLIPGEQRDPMINMHLDTYLNIAGDGIAVGCVPLLKRARVEVYRKKSRGRYEKEPRSTNVHDYLVEKDFTIVPITTLEQISYASNFLCIRDRQILAVEVDKVVEKVLKNLESQAASYPDRYGVLFNQATKEYAELGHTAEFFPHKKELYDLGVKATPMILDELTGGYGGAHCMTCVVGRSEA